ncbi:hypothetical protein [uncultured Prevotella sp.]|uniref:hypothetical protein n=1 Tax=uncultured Prevotella sp. TaxID=159272 RepID=UPI002609B4B5|nr:hypothetical protein [uncultured Prevotella sp.]
MDLRRGRRILLFLVFVCIASGAFADNTYHQKETDDYVTLGDLTVEPGKDEVYKLKVNLNGTQIYTAFEMDIELPSGLEPVMEKDSKGDMRPKVMIWRGQGTIYPYTVDEETGDRDFSYILFASYGVIGKNILRMSVSVNGKDFTATSGTLVTIYCKASPYLKPGVDDVHITKCHFTTNEKVIIDGKEKRGQQYNCKDRTETITALPHSTATINVSSKNQWGSCVVPFDIPELPSGLEAYTVTDRESGIAYLKPQTSILAYTPVLLYAENGFSGTFSGDVDETKYKEVAQQDIIYGAIVPQTKNNGFVLQNLGEGVKLYAMSGQKFEIPAGKCWVEPTFTNGAKYMEMVIDDGTTGIGNAECSNGIAQHEPVFYSLDGKRVENPLPGNIYIVDGQKVLKLK